MRGMKVSVEELLGIRDAMARLLASMGGLTQDQLTRCLSAMPRFTDIMCEDLIAGFVDLAVQVFEDVFERDVESGIIHLRNNRRVIFGEDYDGCIEITEV